MSRDGLLPPLFSRVHPKFKTPHIGTIITGVFVGGAAMFASLDEMVDLTNIGTLFAFFLVCIGIMILRIKDPGRERSFRVPFGPYLLPILGAISCIGLAYYLPPSSWWRFVKWFLVGIVFYALYGYNHSRLRRAPAPTPELAHDFNPEQKLPESDIEHRD